MPPAQRKNGPDLSALKAADQPAEKGAENDSETGAETESEGSVLDRRVTALGDTVEALSYDLSAYAARFTAQLDGVLDAVYGSGVRPALPGGDENAAGGDDK